MFYRLLILIPRNFPFTPEVLDKNFTNIFNIKFHSRVLSSFVFNNSNFL